MKTKLIDTGCTVNWSVSKQHQ